MDFCRTQKNMSLSGNHSHGISRLLSGFGMRSWGFTFIGGPTPFRLLGMSTTHGRCTVMLVENRQSQKRQPRRVLGFRHTASMNFISVHMGNQRILNITICFHYSPHNRLMLRSGRISFFLQGQSLLAQLQCITMVLPCGILQ